MFIIKKTIIIDGFKFIDKFESLDENYNYLFFSYK